jgi:hypothetical protein
MVTKRCTNDFKGSARAFHTSKSYQANPQIPGEAIGYLSTINQIDKIDDNGGEIGGPILKDRLWFWGAYGKQKINIITPTVVFGSRFHDTTELKNENLKFNAQPIASNSLTVVDQYGAKIKFGRNVGSTRLPETAWNQNDTYAHGVGSLRDPTLWKIEDTQLIGSSLYLTGLYSKVQGGFQLIADNGQGCTSFACGTSGLPAWFDESKGTWTRSYVSQISFRPQKQWRADGSAFKNTGSVSHELKFGYGYHEATVSTQTGWPGAQYTDNYAINGIHVGPGGRDTGVVTFMRGPISPYGEKTTDLYVGDTMLVGNLTVQAGLRYDQQKGFVGAGIAPGNPNIPAIMPTLNFGAVSGLKWTNVSPRLGLTYALGSDRKTLVRGGYSRYVNQINAGLVTPVSGGAYSKVYYYFNDLNGNNAAEPSEVDFAAGLARGVLPATSASTSRTRWASNLKAPYTDEITLGGERELLTDFSVGINGTYRKLQNFTQTIGEKHQGQGDFYTSADYVLAPFKITAQLPNGAVVSQPYYLPKAGVSPATFSVIRNLPDYYQNYKGLELTATKRLANRWMLRGNFTFQDWTQHIGSGAIVDPSQLRGGTGCSTCQGSEVLTVSTGSGSKGNVYLNSKWASSLTGTYQIPMIETSFGFNLNSRQGYALPYVALVRTNTGEGTKAVLMEPNTDTFRNGNVTELDLRLAKDIRFSRVGLTLSVDGFNMTNSNTILQRNLPSVCTGQSFATATVTNPGALSACAATPTSNRVSEVLSPRVFRLGARLSF